MKFSHTIALSVAFVASTSPVLAAEKKEVPLTAATKFTSVQGMKPKYKANEPLSLKVSGVEKETGFNASPSRGWHIQYNVYQGPIPWPRTNLEAAPGSLGGNATFENGQWVISTKAPKANGEYFLGISLYCSGGLCWEKGYGDMAATQLNYDTVFTVGVRPVLQPAQRTVTEVCTDSDGGKQYRKRGTVKAKNDILKGTENLTDRCQGNVLTEYSCRGNVPIAEEFPCPKGCKLGACTLEKPQTKPATISRVWFTPDSANTSDSSIMMRMWMEVKKSDGKIATQYDHDEGEISLSMGAYSPETKNTLVYGNLGMSLTPQNTAAYTFGFGKSRSTLPQKETYIFTVSENGLSVRKAYEITFAEKGYTAKEVKLPQ